MKSVSPVVPGKYYRETVFAKDQPPYTPLPAVVIDTRVTSRWKLSWSERLKVLWHGSVWLTLLNFGTPLTPSRLDADVPEWLK